VLLFGCKNKTFPWFSQGGLIAEVCGGLPFGTICAGVVKLCSVWGFINFKSGADVPFI
jgi:hypothetical protein